MTKVVRLRESRTRRRGVYFSRFELNQLLNLYSRRGMSGEWRDYAIDHRAGEVVFSIFRHTAEQPLFAISKTVAGNKDAGRDRGIYVVSRGPETLARSHSITEALSVLDRKPRLVPVS